MRSLLLLMLSGCPIVVTFVTQDYNTLCARLIVAGQLDEADAPCVHALDDASVTLERATTLDVNDDRAWLMRGACEQARGRQPEAKDAFERCLLANEKNLECQQALKAIDRG